MKQDKELRGTHGGFILAMSDTNREEPDFLQWQAPPGMMFGIVSNTPDTRKFLVDVLRRFRRDASRLKARKKKAKVKDAAHSKKPKSASASGA